MNIIDLAYATDQRNRPGRSALTEVSESPFRSPSVQSLPTGFFPLPVPGTGYMRSWTHLAIIFTAGTFGAAGDSYTLSRIDNLSSLSTPLVSAFPGGVLGNNVGFPLIGNVIAGAGNLGNAVAFKGVDGGFFMAQREFLQVFVTANTAVTGATWAVTGWYKDYPV